MRIAVLSLLASQFSWGGSEELWAAMADAALAAGHALHVSTRAWREPAPRVAELVRKGASLSLRPSVRPGRVDELLYRVVDPLRDLEAFRPDVLCVTQGETYECAYSTLSPRLVEVCERHAVPYVVVCQSLADQNGLGGAQRARARAIFRNADRVCVLSRHMAEALERQLGLALPNAVVVRNPVNLASREAVAWPPGATARFAVVGELAPRKGQDLLLDALRRGPWPGRDWRLTLYGKGTEAPEYARLAALYGLADRVELAGQAPDIRAVWAREQLFVLPSFYEGVPLAMVEAMVCGRPVLVSDVGGNREWVERGVTGFLSPAGSVDGLGEALEAAWTARDRWPAMGAAAREAAMARLDPAPGQTLLDLLLQVGRRT